MHELLSNISYIIGFRESNNERKDALVFVLRKLRNYFPELQIMVIEQDREPKLTLDDALNIKQSFIFNDGLYNRCWAFNFAVKQTEKKILAFADADIFLEKEDFFFCFKAATVFQAITPNKIEAINVAVKDKATLKYEVHDKRPLFTFAGGLIILTREGYRAIGGWDERFEGWGGEDEALSHLIYNSLTSKTFSFPMYHIDHPRSSFDGDQHPKYVDNRNLVEEILTMNEEAHVHYVQYIQNKKNGDVDKYRKPEKRADKKNKAGKDLKFVLAVTTFNRLEYLESCINSFFNTRNDSISWHLLIADDGSTDGTKAYLKEIQTQYGATIIHNERAGIHRQVNTVLKYLSNIKFDLCFKCDDDIIFQQLGWDMLYWETIQRTGYQHLIFYDKNWRPHVNLERPLTRGSLVAHCLPEKIQGAFYTLTKEVLQKVGYFDEQRFGGRGLGHIDYSFRCCRAGFNIITHPFDVKNSSDYIQLQNSETYTGALSSKYKSILNPKEILEYKKTLIRSNRIFIPYNENFQPADRIMERGVGEKTKFNKTLKKSSHKKADTTFYPERGIAGFFGFLLKKFYNLCIDLRLFFIPRIIKTIGKLLNKLSLDLINIED